MKPDRTDVKLHTFDIFDTCLIRNVFRPDHVHWAVALKLSPGKLGCQDAEDWRRRRVGAESQARMIPGRVEVDIDEIYEQLQQFHAIPADAVEAAKTAEIAFELESVTANGKFLALVKSLAKDHTVAFVSDFYMHEPIIREMVLRAGFPDIQRFVSCDYRKTKHQGDFFGVVASTLGVSTNAIRHEGDNPRSDVVNARKAGLQARLYAEGGLSRYERLLYETGGSHYVSSAVAGSARSARLSADPAPGVDKIVWEIGCDVAGPILGAFVLWIITDAVEKGKKRLYFLARDGQVLTKLANLIIAWRGYDLKAYYMYASRQALHTASLSLEFATAVDQILTRAKSKTVAEMLADLEVGNTDRSRLLEAAGLAGTEVVGSTQEAARALLHAHEAGISASIARRRAAYALYLDQIDLKGNAEEAMVDLGWGGNLQACIFEMIPGSEHHFTGYYYSLKSAAARIEGRYSLFTSFSNNINTALLETFCMADHNSVQGFDLDAEDGPQLLLKDRRDDGPPDWTVDLLQDAIVTYMSHLLRAAAAGEVGARQLLETLKPAALAVFEEFRAWPSSAEAAAFGSVVHAADQGHKVLDRVAEKLDVTDFILRSTKYRRAMRFWRYGVLSRSLPEPVVAAILRSRSSHNYMRGRLKVARQKYL